MAELDDFFAKKDKKKSKGSRAGPAAGRFSTAEQVARKLESQDGPPPPRPRPKKDKTDEAPGAHEEDEWREFEEQKKDYSGLRIQNMQLSESTEASGKGAGNDDDADEEGSGRRGAPGPWKKASSDGPREDSDDEEPPPAPEQASATTAETPNAPSAYKPPHLRNATGSSMSNIQAPGQMRGGRGRAAPDINNEAYFPTLSAAETSAPTGAWGKKGRREEEMRGFEDVRNSKSHSSRYEGMTHHHHGPSGGGSNRPVSMENKYAALRGADQS